METSGKENMMQALALLYHDVVPSGHFETSGFRTIGADRYKLGLQEFEEHLTAIAASIKRKPVQITDEDWQDSFLFTMDDGGCSAMHVADSLESRNWHGHFFVTTNFIDTPGFLSRGEIRELAVRGHVIGSHSCSHPTPMWNCSTEQLFTEWNESRQKLEQILGDSVIVASLPGGFYVVAVAKAAARAKLRVLFTSEPTRRVHQVDGCCVVGRYCIMQVTSAAEAAKLARGDVLVCAKQQIFWNSKKLLKKVASQPYAAVRTYILQRSAPPTSDDSSAVQHPEHNVPSDKPHSSAA
jgi:peptidoglycan/xylan/chitin deacetylase (PgdA/CDA1 family)